MKNILVITATHIEQQAILKGLDKAGGFDVVISGVGPIAAAVATTKALKNKYDLVISSGIAGGFKDKAQIGSLVMADTIIAADLGTITSDGFVHLDELGLGSNQLHVDPSILSKLKEALTRFSIPVTIGPMATLATITGTSKVARDLTYRIPGIISESMEGFGVAYAAHSCGVAFTEIRAISNVVGPRNKEAWRTPDALKMLTKCFGALKEVTLENNYIAMP